MLDDCCGQKNYHFFVPRFLPPELSCELTASHQQPIKLMRIMIMIMMIMAPGAAANTGSSAAIFYPVVTLSNKREFYKKLEIQVMAFHYAM